MVFKFYSISTLCKINGSFFVYKLEFVHFIVCCQMRTQCELEIRSQKDMKTTLWTAKLKRK